MEEIYITIQEFPNYQISNLGNVKNVRTKRILSPQTDKDGYKLVCLYNNKVAKTKRLHRLLGQYFIPNPENKKEIDHIDNNPSNNELSNLRWASSSDNKKNRNKVINTNFSSSYIGVSYSKKIKKWRARITNNGIETHIGSFKTEIEASQARDNYIINNNLQDGFYKLNDI
jgi:hypothetical protein